MKFPGRIYRGKENLYLAIYSFYPDICVAVPQSIERMAKRVAHVSYSKGAPRKGIDIFLLQKPHPEIPELALQDEIQPGGEYIKETDEKHDVQYQLVNGTPKELLDLARKDIEIFCRGKIATKPEGTRKDYVEEIVPTTFKRVIQPRIILTPGKQEFVPSCGLEANIDFSQGCISGWIKGKKGYYDSDTGIFSGFFLDPNSECEYCYAKPKHRTFPKTIFDIDKKRLKEELLGKCQLTTGSREVLGRPVKILRFGKRTESCSELTLDSFALTLETMAEIGTRGIVPTKFLKFNREIAELLRKTNSTILYSIGFDEFERGACSHGCDNEFRLEQATKYGDSKVNSIIYLMIANPSIPPSERELKIIKFAEQHKNSIMGVQLLPLRYTSKDLIRKMTKFHWDVLKSKPHPHLFPDEFENLRGTYYSSSGVLIPKKVNDSWLKLIEDNNGFFRMCHHNQETLWCGGCFKEPGVIEEMPERNIRKVNKAGKNNKQRGKKLF